MPENDAGFSVAERAGRLDVLHLFDGENLAAHDAGHGQPLDGADRGEEQEDFAHALHFVEGMPAEERELAEPYVDGLHGLLEEDHHQDDEDREGERVEDVDDAHHDGVEFAACVAGDRAVGDADGQGDERGDESDHDGDASAVEDAGEQVASVDIGAEPVVGAGADGAEVEVHLTVGLREERAEGAQEREEDEDHAAEDSDFVFAQALPGVLPGRAAGLGCVRTRSDGCGAHSNLSFGLSQTWTTSTTRLRVTMSVA